MKVMYGFQEKVHSQNTRIINVGENDCLNRKKGKNHIKRGLIEICVKKEWKNAIMG